jgi:hypothetical protein
LLSLSPFLHPLSSLSLCLSGQSLTMYPRLASNSQPSCPSFRYILPCLCLFQAP